MSHRRNNDRNQPTPPKPWKKRRAILDAIHRDHRLTTGARAYLGLLLDRSDDTGKPVWGNQKKMAASFGRCDRTIRRYRDELEQLGYLKVYRARPERGSDGRWSRRRSNSYYFCLPARSTAAKPAPRHRAKAGYCVLHPIPAPANAESGSPVWRGRRTHLADNHDRSTPQEGALTSAAPALQSLSPSPANAPEQNETERARPEVVHAYLAEARAALTALKPTRRPRPPR